MPRAVGKGKADGVRGLDDEDAGDGGNHGGSKGGDDAIPEDEEVVEEHPVDRTDRPKRNAKAPERLNPSPVAKKTS